MEKKIYFIGIGGIGVSALAQYYLAKGHKVSGSDLVSSEIINQLDRKGIEIIIGEHNAQNLPKNTNIVIYSPAVQKSNPELKKALKLKIKCQTYPQALGELTKKYFTIAVSGTHGKSTTTSMLSIVLEKAGFDPTVIIGTKLKEFNNLNFKSGKSKYLIIEADEHFASFLNYWPKIIILTNIDKEHLDYYKNLNHIIKTYKDYVNHLPEDGILITNKDDNNITKLKSLITKTRQRQTIGHRRNKVSLTSKKKFKIIDYSLKQIESKKIKKILNVPGNHNVYNALSVLALTRILKIPDNTTLKALALYKGSWRRFQEIKTKISNKKVTIISDFGHHPTEIKATLIAIREKFKKRKIWYIYQPHQYQRTFYLFNDFIKTFKNVLQQQLIDKIIITDIYDVSGREEKKIKKNINSEKLIKKINELNASYLKKEKIIDFLKKNIKENEVILIMGAGDIYEIINDF